MSWNINQGSATWTDVLDARHELGVDVALLQEAPPPVTDLACAVLPARADEVWFTRGAANRPWRTAIACLDPHVELHEVPTTGIDDEAFDSLAVSRPGTVTVGRVLLSDGSPVHIASVYGVWERHLEDGSGFIWADSSVHRVLSDLSPLMTGRASDIPLIVAGDFNLLYGYAEDGQAYWDRRYQAVFARAAAMGLRFLGPQAPDGGRQVPTEVWPAELPRTSRNVPTFHSGRQTPATATRQLDYVLVSESLAPRVRVTALNAPESWGPSDHCRILIDVHV